MNNTDVKKAIGCFFICAAMWLATTTAMAEETTVDDPAGYEDVFSGFDDPDTERLRPETIREPSRYQWGGSLALSGTWNVNHKSPPPEQADFRGLSRLRAELDLEFRADIYDTWRLHASGRGVHDFAYAIQGRDQYTRQVLNAYESELEFLETYLQGSPLPDLDLTIGRQIIVWGNTENFRVTDVLNPEDNRDPGLVDIEYRRLPVFIIKADYYWDDPRGRYTLTGLMIPERRYDKNPVYGNDFYPLDFPMPPDNLPLTRLGNSDLAMSLTGIFHNWDLSLYAANFYDRFGYIRHTGFYGIINPTPILERRVSRLKMVGLSANFVSGSWLWKTETAWTDGYEYNHVDEQKGRLDMLAGFEYMGFSNTTLTLEFTREYMPGFDERMREPPDFAEKSQFATAFRITRTWMNDRLEGVFLAMAWGEKADEGALERLSLAYDISDAMTVTGGCVLYQSGEAVPVDHIHRNNRLFFDVKYSF